MKKVMILLSILVLTLTLVLLAGCSGEAKEPAPAWPERLTGEYDASLTFTLKGTAPEAAGVDSLTGRMTALFPTDGGTLALGWRRVAGAEAELLEDYLSGTGGEVGVWERDTAAPNALESYVRLGRSWFCLSAACDGMEEAALLRLVDGAVEAKAGEETALPRAASSAWLEELPWEEDWVCLLLEGWELEPEVGKEALRTLLYSYDWVLADPAAEAEEADFYGVDRAGKTLICLPDGEWLTFRLEENGDLRWNGTLRRPLGEGAGEKLLGAFSALAETGVSTTSPPRLTLVSGSERVPANLHGTYSWLHVTRAGRSMGCESDGFSDYDWLGAGRPVLEAEGPVTLDFATEAPDRMSLFVDSDLGSAPLAVTAEGFTPLAGLHTYSLGCTWEREDAAPGGSGSCTYILLIEGAEDLGPEPVNAENLTLTLREADAWGCTYILEKRGLGTCEPVGTLNALFRRTAAGGWDWVEPIRIPYEGTMFSMTGDVKNENLAWEWSYAYGVLEPGEYRFQQAWRYIYSGTRALWLVSADFTVTDTQPEFPGPLALREMPEGLETSLARLSPHRWAQTVSPREESADGWRIEDDFSLFRLGEDGSLTFLPPTYRLPKGMTESYPLFRKERLLEINLTARYGELEAGSYVLRRRVLRLGPEDRTDGELMGQSVRWRLIPEERIEYLDAVLTLDTPLSAPAYEVEPIDPLLYTGEALAFPLDTGEGWYGSRQARVVLETPAYADFPYNLVYNPKNYGLYFREGEEWLPLKRQRYFRLRGIDEVLQQPGSSMELNIYFDSVYGDLEPGTYRLVLPASAIPRKEGLEEKEGFIVIQFRRTPEGDGVWEDVGE